MQLDSLRIVASGSSWSFFCFSRHKAVGTSKATYALFGYHGTKRRLLPASMANLVNSIVSTTSPSLLTGLEKGGGLDRLCTVQG